MLILAPADNAQTDTENVDEQDSDDEDVEEEIDAQIVDLVFFSPQILCMWCEYTTADKQPLKQHVQVVHRGIGNLCDHCN